MTLSLFKLLVFVTVVDRNGYSSAAEYLELSQATVSFHVRSLEQQLRTPLVRYEHRSIRLTSAGEQTYRSARVMLQHEQQLLRAVGGSHGEQVKLGASMAFEQAFFFEDVVAPFRRAHPDVLLSLRFGHSVGLAEAVLNHDLDLGYLIGWHVPSGLRFEQLHQATFVFLVAHEHPLAGRDTVSVDDIARAGLITAPLDHVEWAHYGDVLRDVGLGPNHVTLEVDGIQARALATEAGLGVLGTFHPPYAGTNAYGALVPLPFEHPTPTTDVGLVTRRGDTPTDSTRSLADWIQQATQESTPQ